MSEVEINGSELLDSLSIPALMVEKGMITHFNKSARETFFFNSDPPIPVDLIWDDFNYETDSSVEMVKLVGYGSEKRISMAISRLKIKEKGTLVLCKTRGDESYILEPDSGYGSFEWFTEKLDLLVDLGIMLPKCETLSDIYRTTVQFSLEKLDIDRIGILLFDHEKNTYYGTWGTDIEGKLKDESDFSAPIPDSGWTTDAFRCQTHSQFADDLDLKNYGEVVGHGWNGMVNIWLGNRVIGWIAADNLINHRPLTVAMKELLRQVAGVLSRMVAYNESEKLKEEYGKQLQEALDRKTTELDIQHKKNMALNQRLKEKEILETLGETIAGIAHEINGPIGNSVTLASSLQAEAEEVKAAIDSKTLTLSAMNHHLEILGETTHIILGNLQQASDLIKAFHSTAVDQLSDRLVTINFHNLFHTIFLTQKHLLKRRNIDVELNIPLDVELISSPGLITQIFVNLITNSLRHGFGERMIDNQIRVDVEKNGPTLRIQYRDNGKGIAEENKSKIFESFYTTYRDSGGSGLGLYIVKDIVENQLKGTLELDSVEGEYTMFTLVLPELTEA